MAISAPRRGFLILAVLYGLGIVYSSLILGPEGLHYVAISPAEAWVRFLAVSYIDNASDQRPDWIANMMMTIPLAFFVNGALLSRQRGISEIRGQAATLLICAVFVLAVKYGQLFFPPRTVTLNYILAQSIGVALGVLLFAFTRRKIYPAVLSMHREGEGLVIVLGAYTLLVTGYFLMPFDLALSPDDLATRLSQVPLALAPGAGHDLPYRAMLMAADVASTIPVGMLLAVTGRDLSFRSLILRGVGFILPVTILSLFVLSATPFALSLMTRMAGVSAGIGFMWALKGKDLWKRHYRYARFVPIAFTIYLVFVAFAGGLLTTHWLDPYKALDAMQPSQLFPLWTFYMASKVEAAQSFVATFCLFAPIGAMIWLRRGFWSRGARLSAFLAFSLSMLVEVGRLAKPGLTPDFTDPVIAAIGAGLTFLAMPVVWKMFEQEAKISAFRDNHLAEIQRVAQLFNVTELHVRPSRQPALPDRNAWPYRNNIRPERDVLPKRRKI